jgi:hypothetical protein
MIGTEVPKAWREGFELGTAKEYSLGEVVAAEYGDAMMFAKIVEKRESKSRGGGIEYAVEIKEAGKGSKRLVKTFMTALRLRRIEASAASPAVKDTRMAKPGKKDEKRQREREAEQKQELDELMQRYGESFEIQTFLDNGSFTDKDEDSASDRRSDEFELSEARRRQVRKWVERRSDEDVKAFRDWFNDMYARHPEIGMTLLDWRIPAVWEDAPAAPSPPPEWGTIADLGKVVPTTGGRQPDLSINVFEGESLLRKTLMEKLGIDKTSINLFESLLVAILVSLSLTFGFTWIERGDINTVEPPSGVDAYLMKTDYDSGPGDGQTQKNKNPPRPVKATVSTYDRPSSILSVEDRLKIQRLISKGLDNADIMKAFGAQGSSSDSGITDAGIDELRRDMMRIERGDFM